MDGSVANTVTDTAVTRKLANYKSFWLLRLWEEIVVYFSHKCEGCLYEISRVLLKTSLLSREELTVWEVPHTDSLVLRLKNTKMIKFPELTMTVTDYINLIKPGFFYPRRRWDVDKKYVSGAPWSKSIMFASHYQLPPRSTSLSDHRDKSFKQGRAGDRVRNLGVLHCR